MNIHHSIGAVLFGAALFAAGTTSAAILDKKASKPNEVVGTAAKGDPKPYHALVQGTCDVGSCTVDFGKKAKVRRIELITCGVITDEEPQLAGIVFGELADGDIRFFLPLSSVAPQGMGKVGMFQFAFGFDVPPTTRLQVILQASGMPTVGTCTATGTLG